MQNLKFNPSSTKSRPGRGIKNLLLVVLALIIASFVLTKSAVAFWPFDGLKKDQMQTKQADKFPPMIQKLIDRFKLNEDEVVEVMDEIRQERQAQAQGMVEQKLDKAVEAGKITQEQKQAILDKKNQIQAQHQELKNLSSEERQEKTKEDREEMKAWAQENGLDWPVFGLNGKRDFGRGW